MSNKFDIILSATDDFSKQFQKLDEAAQGSNDKATKGAKKLGKDLTESLRSGSRHAVDLATNLGGASSAMAEFARLGAAGSLAGIAVGLGVMEMKWARAGFEIDRTSSLLGVSTEVLQKWRGIAQLTGTSTENMTGALSGLARTMQDSVFGRNDLARGFFSARGIPLRKNAEGMWDVEAALVGVSEAMRSLDPQARLKLAGILGIPEDVIPTLMKGKDALTELGKKAQELGAVQGKESLQWAVEMTNAMNRLGVAAEGVKNRFGAWVTPGLVEAMGRVSSRAEESASGHPYSAAFGGMADFFLQGPRYLRSLMPSGSPAPTGSRKVSGVVTSDGEPMPSEAITADAVGRLTATAAQRRVGTSRAEMARDLQAEYDANPDPGNRAEVLRGAAMQKIEIKVSVPDGAKVTANSNGAAIKIERAMQGF